MTRPAPSPTRSLRAVRAFARFRVDRAGTAAVEFAMIGMAFVMLFFGILQFVILHYTQQLLSDALYTSASKPEAVLLAENRSAYATIVCNRVPIVMNCSDPTTGVRVEMMRLADLPTTSTAITGTTFDSGTFGDVLVLRATTQALQIVPFIPALTVRDSVVFRRSWQ